jgi:hypothetical protein
MGEGAVLTTALSTVVSADRGRVWRALTDPAEVPRWDAAVRGLVDAPNGYPHVGVAVRWRYHVGSVTLLLRDRPLEVVPLERLRSDVSLGSFRFDQTWSLAPGEGAPGRTRLGLHLASSNEVALLGAVLDRFDVRRMAAEYVDARLRSLRRWCEETSARTSG